MTTWEDVIKTGDVNAVKDYIAQGAAVSAKNEKGKTALDFAKAGDDPDIVALLEKAMK